MPYEVYVITCAPTGKHYVGCTKIGTQNRLRRHFSDARKKYTTALGDAIRAHGEDLFSAQVLWFGDTVEEMYATEIRLIRQFGSLTPIGYNITPGGPGAKRSRRVYVKTGPRGPLPSEVKEKMRLAKLGKRVSEETKAKLRAANLGKKRTPESIEKSRLAALGRKPSEETRAKMSRAQKGRIIRPESLVKLKLALTGRPRRPELIRRQIETWQRKRMAKSLALSYGISL